MGSDQRLDDFAARTARRFDDLEHRMELGFDRVDRDIRELRTDMRDMRVLMFQLWGSTIVGILGAIAAVLLTST